MKPYFVPSGYVISFCLMFLFVISQSPVSGQSLAEAEQLSTSGNFWEAEKKFRELLVQNPDDPDIILGNAYNLSWMGSHKRAIDQFQLALKMKADPLKTYLGMAYSYAWSGNYGMARSIFSTLLRQYPGNFDAQKGLAYSYLWQGKNQMAANQFEQLILDNGSSYELLLSKGLAHLNNKEIAAAEDAFQQALLLQPNAEEAQQYIQITQQSAHFLEGNLWMGYSVLDDQTSRWGLRGIQLSAQLHKNWRGILKYDNSLAMDILNFVRQNQNIPTMTAGLVREWDQHWTSELEYGLRFLDNGLVQQLFSGGQVYFLPGNASLKIGGFIGFGQDIPAEGLAFISFNLPISGPIRMEPTYFFVRPPNNSSTEHRFQMKVGYTSNSGFELGLYGIYGRTSIGGEARQKKELFGWSISTLVPVTPSFSGQLIVRQEEGIFNDITSMAAGLRVRLNR